MIRQTSFQIGKNGITEEVIKALSNSFETHKIIRISMLKSSGRNRDSIKLASQELIERLGGNFKATIIGFTIILRRLAKKELDKEV
jgi:RNA-binding protein YhbY